MSDAATQVHPRVTHRSRDGLIIGMLMIAAGVAGYWLRAWAIGAPAAAVEVASSSSTDAEVVPGGTETNGQATDRLLSIELTEKVSIPVVLVPAGSFEMGSRFSPQEVASRFGGQMRFFTYEHPRHEVTLTQPFYMAKNEITVAQFAAFVAASGYVTDAERGGQPEAQGLTGGMAIAETSTKVWRRWAWAEGVSWREPGFPQEEDHPVVYISFDDAMAFCAWLSEKSGRTVRLPTEAEWEYAARGGTATAFPWGDHDDVTGRMANVADQTVAEKFQFAATMDMDDGWFHTAPVGRYQPNRFGLHDVIGNVAEWCADWYRHDYYKSSPGQDPVGPGEGQAHVARGGAWFSNPSECRAAARTAYGERYRDSGLGFRVVVDADRAGPSGPAENGSAKP